MALSGKKTVSTAGTQVVLGTEQPFAPVLVKALTTNTGLVYLGDATTATSTNGLPLLPGESVVFTYVGTLGSVYVNSAVNGEGVAWVILAA